MALITRYLFEGLSQIKNPKFRQVYEYDLWFVLGADIKSGKYKIVQEMKEHPYYLIGRVGNSFNNKYNQIVNNPQNEEEIKISHLAIDKSFMIRTAKRFKENKEQAEEYLNHIFDICLNNRKPDFLKHTRNLFLIDEINIAIEPYLNVGFKNFVLNWTDEKEVLINVSKERIVSDEEENILTKKYTLNENTMNEIFKKRFQEATDSEIPALLGILDQHYQHVPSYQRGSFNQLKQEFYDQPNNFVLSKWKARFLTLIGEFKFEIPIPELPKISNTMQTPKQAPAIFTAFADSEGDLKNLNKEQKDIQNSFLNLDSQDKLKYIVSIETSLDNYFKFLGSYQNRIAIFHYGGHAGSTGITLQDGHLSFEHLAEELVDRNKNSLVFVFLNGCATKAHVETLFNLGVPLVLATAVPIADDTATIFAQKFYENLTNNSDSISMAYKSASRYIKAKNTQINATLLGQVSRMSDLIQGVSTQNEAFPWGLYVREGKEDFAEKKLIDFMSSSNTKSDKTTRTIHAQSYFEKIDKIDNLNIDQSTNNKDE